MNQPDSDKLRIGDSDRELVSRLLKRAVDEGRLTLVEYDERLQLVFDAKTVGDLTPVTGDLITAGTALAAVEDEPKLDAVRPRRRGTPVWIRWLWFGWATPAAVLWMIWLLTVILGGVDDLYGVWPVWPTGITGVLCLSVTAMERMLIRPSLEERDRQRALERRRRRADEV